MALDAVADGTRRRILELLGARPRTVGELAHALPVSQPAVSQHLKVLREASLVRSVKDGTRRIQHLDPTGFQGLRDWVDSFWDGALDAYRSSFTDDPETGEKGR
jgi:DNA-binding transcriptional ArsR family regulator